MSSRYARESGPCSNSRTITLGLSCSMPIKANLPSWDGAVCSWSRRRMSKLELPVEPEPTSARERKLSSAKAPRGGSPLWFKGLAPLVLLAALVVLFLRVGPVGVFQQNFPPVEELTIERILLPAQGVMQVQLVNGGPEPVTVAQVMVDDANWVHRVDGSRTIDRLERRTITIPYPWVEGEPHTVSLVTSTGLTFVGDVAVATLSPAVDRFLPEPDDGSTRLPRRRCARRGHGDIRTGCGSVPGARPRAPRCGCHTAHPCGSGSLARWHSARALSATGGNPHCAGHRPSQSGRGSGDRGLVRNWGDCPGHVPGDWLSTA